MMCRWLSFLRASSRPTVKTIVGASLQLRTHLSRPFSPGFTSTFAARRAERGERRASRHGQCSPGTARLGGAIGAATVRAWA